MGLEGDGTQVKVQYVGAQQRRFLTSLYFHENICFFIMDRMRMRNALINPLSKRSTPPRRRQQRRHVPFSNPAYRFITC